MDELTALLRDKRVVVLTGAGASTESGIPDYRGPETSRRARNPIQFSQFVQDPAWRSRYWARSTVGWPLIRDAVPNPGHRALADLGWPVITQNVDRLHTKAGSHALVELHGALAEVVCLSCGRERSRQDLQLELLARNPHLRGLSAEQAPDGDAELSEGADVPNCACGGLYKPHVVFFGENVPRPRVESAYAWVDQCDTLLVVGTSLTVFSGFRFVKRAVSREIPVAIVNLNETRGDAMATLKIADHAGRVLPKLRDRLRSHPIG